MLDLPAIERAEVLTDKDNWDEIETQMFLFQKGDTKMGLRYDGTVGLSRYVAGHLNDLVFPFRASQFSKRYRGERAQLSVISKALDSVNEFIGPNVVHVGSRPFWDALFDYLEMNADQKKSVFVLIDKKDKMGDDDFAEGLKDALNNAEQENTIKSVFADGYKIFMGKSEKLDAAISELTEFIKTLDGMGVKNAKIDLSIARGLAYYTGLVFEFKLPEHPEFGTAAGGGRYENLASKFSKTKIVGVGAAIGFSRIFASMLENNQIDLSRFSNPIDVAVLVMGNNNVAYASKVVNILRDAEIAAVSYLDTDKKFKNQIEYADKTGAKFAAIIGDDEVSKNVIALKNMESGNQETLSLSDAIKNIKVK